MTAREGIADGGLQTLTIPDFENRLHRCREIAAICGQRRRACGEVREPGRRQAIGAKAVVEAPAQNRAPQLKHLRRLERIGDSREQALVGRQLQGQGAAAVTAALAVQRGCV